MGFRKALIQLYRPNRRYFSLVQGLFRGDNAIMAEDTVRVGQLGIGGPVVWINGDRLMIIVNRIPPPLA